MKDKFTSNGTGDTGEAFFNYWIRKVTRSSTAQKVIEDYGYDFYITIFTPYDSNGKSSETGRLALANVKSTQVVNGSRQVDFKTLSSAVKSQQLVIFFLVDLEEEKVGYQFVDKNFLKRSIKHLKDKKGFTLSRNNVEFDDGGFLEKLLEQSEENHQKKLNYLKLRLNLESIVGDLDLKLTVNEDGSLAKVVIYNPLKLFDQSADQQALVKSFFLAAHSAGTSSYFRMNSELKAELDKLADTVELTISTPVEMNVILGSFLSDQSITTCSFELRHLGEEIYYTHPSGFCLGISKCREEGESHHHDFNIMISSADGTIPFYEDKSFVEFIKAVGASSKLIFGSHEKGISVEGIDHFTGLGRLVTFFDKVCDVLQIGQEKVKLTELADPQYADSFLLLDRIINSKGHPFFELTTGKLKIGFEQSDLVFKEALFKIPISLHLPNGDFIVEFQLFGKIGESSDRSISQIVLSDFESVSSVESIALGSMPVAILTSDKKALVIKEESSSVSTTHNFDYGIEYAIVDEVSDGSE